jgi:hypothetical protein
MRRLIRTLLGSFPSDNRGMGTSTTAAGAAGMLVVVAAVTAGTAVPSDATGDSNPQEQVQVVQDGLKDSLEEANNEVVNKDEAADNSRERQIAAHVRRAIPEHAWNNLPTRTRKRLTQQVGGFMAQVDAQASVDSELMRVDSAGDGIVRGATLKQHGTGSRTVTDSVKETYTATEQRIDHWEHYIKRYKTKVTGTERVQVGTKQVQVGTTTRLKTVQETYQHAVYDTKRTVSYEPRTRTRTVTTWEEVCYPTDYGQTRCQMMPDTTVVTETYYVKTYDTRTVFSHYETRTRYVEKMVTVPVYETRPVYEQQSVTKKVPVYDRRPVYKTVNVQKTRTKQVEKEVKTAPFVIEDNEADWNLATDVEEARDATMRIEKSMLTKEQSKAFQLVADSQTSSETWRMSVWQDNGEIVIQTNNGVQRRVAGEFADINFDKGTINGQDASIQLANGIEGPYTLSVENGDKARGTYQLTINGEPSVKAQAADIANDEAGVTVVDGIVYEATFDVTYESGDTTYTDRVTIAPAVNVTTSPDASDSAA